MTIPPSYNNTFKVKYITFHWRPQKGGNNNLAFIFFATIPTIKFGIYEAVRTAHVAENGLNVT